MSDADILSRRLSVPGCVVVCTQLTAHCNSLRTEHGHKLVPPVEKAYKAVVDAAEQIKQARVIDASMTDVDRGSDRCVAGLDGALESITLALDYHDVLPLDDEQRVRAEVASSLRQALFPAGTSFLRLPYRQQWERMSALCQVLEQADVANQLKQLGLQLEARRIRNWTDVYGDKLGVTTARDADAVVRAVQAFHDALGSLHVKVRALYDDENDPTHQLVRRLLLSPYEQQAAEERAAENKPKRKPSPAP